MFAITFPKRCGRENGVWDVLLGRNFVFAGFSYMDIKNYIVTDEDEFINYPVSFKYLRRHARAAAICLHMWWQFCTLSSSSSSAASSSSLLRLEILEKQEMPFC